VRARAGFVIGAVAVASLALAGCVAPTADPSSSGTPTPFVTNSTGAPTPTPTPTVRPTSTPTSTPRPTDDSGDGGGQASVVPLITYSGFDPAGPVVEVSAFVPDIAETDGQCSVTVTNGSETATGSGAARPDVAATQCGSIYAALPSGATGDWIAVVTYSSSTSVGSSAPVSIKIG